VPELIVRGGDQVGHLTACHYPVEPAEDLAHESAAIDQLSTEPTLPSA
jgi:hypothetical protein